MISQSIAQWGGVAAVVLGLMLIGFLVKIFVGYMNRLPCEDYTPEKPALPKNFKPAKALKRARPARTPDRIILGIHEREQRKAVRK